MAVAEKENEIRDPNYLGSIAISDLAGAREIYDHGAPSAVMLASLAYGIKTVYPQFQVTDMLTQKALALYSRADRLLGRKNASDNRPRNGEAGMGEQSICGRIF